ncbi:hypothetical protein [Spirosoma gilvum]
MGNFYEWKSLYQVAQFRGKTKQLKTFFEQNFTPIVFANNVSLIALTLTIDESGEVVRTKVDISYTTATRVDNLVVYVQQLVQQMPKWTAIT